MEMFSLPSTVNYKAFDSNQSKVSNYNNNQLIISLQIFVQVVILLCYSFFLYFVFRILVAFITTPSINEKLRYVLFVHMLINDCVYLALGLWFLLTNGHMLYVPGSLCFFMYIIGNCSFRITPCNLAFMSLERFVAVCFPLRHSELCTAHKANIAIGIIWILGIFPCVIESILIGPLFQKIFSTSLVCNQDVLLLSSFQLVLRTFTMVSTFALVGLIILYTYGKVMTVARKMTSGKSSAQKAGKTVMLHALQLLLCMASLLTNITGQFSINYIVFLRVIKFLAFTYVPRFLSPIIYGIRDELLKKYMKKMYFARH